MTTFPLMDCCKLLSIDPKTLRHWLKQAHMPLSIHPTDARVKCLTHEQVQQLAILHGRMLKPDEACLSVSLRETPPPGARQETLYPHMISDATLGKIPSAVLLEEGDVSQRLSYLQALVVAQQQQLVLLTQALLQERDRRMQDGLSSLDASAHPTAEPESCPSRSEHPTTSLPIQQAAGRPLHPAEQRAHFLVLPPLIEYSASGTYVVISSQEGDIPLIPDSLEWFEWFRTLASFRFVGQSGRLSACRGYRRHHPIRTWYAYRTIHQHDYKHYLGLSEHLTVAHLEAMAAKFQSYVDAF